MVREGGRMIRIPVGFTDAFAAAAVAFAACVLLWEFRHHPRRWLKRHHWGDR